MSKLKNFFFPTKSKLLIFLFFFLLIPFHLLILFTFGDPLTGDRGHESYSGTPLGEWYEDTISWTFFLPFMLTASPSHAIIFTIIYWYLLACGIGRWWEKRKKQPKKKSILQE